MIDSSMSSVPATRTAKSHAAASREEQRLAGLGDVAGDALADPASRAARARPPSDAVSSPRKAIGTRSSPSAEEDAAVVVVDQQPQLVRDRHADLGDVVEPVELRPEALQHLQVRDRADVLAPRPAAGPLRRRVVEDDDLVLAARLGGHHRRLGARDQLARVRRVLGAVGDADRDGDARRPGRSRPRRAAARASPRVPPRARRLRQER